ncbi:MAG: tyrosine-protein kinase family protein [Candidatus Odinarchaeota archaeon]
MSSKTTFVMVHSYKGGTGKTAIAVNLAYHLSKKGKKVLLIELDMVGPSFTNIFKVTTEKYWNHFYSSQQPLKSLITKVGAIDIICSEEGEIKVKPGENLNVFYNRQHERLQRQKAWLQAEGYDYVILDTRPGYTAELVNIILIVDLAILITRLDTDTVNKTIEMYEKVYSLFKNKRIILVQNQVPTPVEGQTDPELDLDVEKSLEKWNAFIKGKVLVHIPYRNDIAYSLFRSKIAREDSPFMRYVEQIAEHIHSDENDKTKLSRGTGK